MIDDDDRQGHPVIEAVLVAGLSALVTGLANWGIERLKKRKRRKPKKRTAKETE